ncbi:MAG: hypothetical protein CMD28_01000 [Flavobacteriales bacterium]|nr:hypothetical protein [Flavobacteriales bacterium]
MFKILPFIISFFLINTQKEVINHSVVYASDNPAERVVWEHLRLVDPNTGEIPKNIRKKEMIFAKTLPKSTRINKTNWLHRGPYNVGGRTRALAFDVLDENTILAGGASGGMFRSVDAGASWLMTTKPSQEHRISCLAQDKRSGKENIWYFGTGENRGSYLSDVSIYGNGIWKSIDGGLSWDSLPITTSNTPTILDGDFDFTFSIKTDISNDSLDVVYVATRGDIYRSDDGGGTWLKQLGGPNNSYYQYTDVDITSQGIVYATISSNCTNKGIWRSVDGQNWVNVTDSLFSPVYSRVVIGINPANENQVYFLAAETTGYGQHTDVFFGGETWTSLWKYEYISGDGTGNGGQWTDLSGSIPTNQSTSFDNFNAQGSYDLVVSVHPSDSNLVIIGGTNLWRSTDGFTSPNNTSIIGGYRVGSSEGDGNWGSYPDHHPDQHVILYLPSNDSVMINGNDGGIFKTQNVFKDTVEWESLNHGYNTTQLYTVAISSNANSKLLQGGFQDNGSRLTFSDNTDATWNMPFNGDGSYAGIADNEEDFYLTIQRGVMYKMKLDTNANRLAFQRMDPASCDSNKYMWMNPMEMDANNDNVMFWAEGNKLWRNNNLNNISYNSSHQKSDFGWEMFSDTLYPPSLKISALSSSLDPPNVLYVGTQNKRIYRVDNAHVGDPSVIQLPDILTAGSSYCTDIAINPLNADEIMIVYSNYSVYSLFHSTDGGQSWNKAAGNLEQNNSGSGNGPSCRDAEIIPLGDDTLYLVGTTVGLFATSKINGINTVWEQIGSATLGSTIVEYITYRQADGLLVVGTFGNGVYQTHLSSVDDILATGDNVDNFDLMLFPNPIIDRLSVVVNIDVNSDAKVVIYDQLGRSMGDAYFQRLYSGNNTIELNFSDYSSGIYFVSFVIDNKNFVQQIIIE